VNRPHSNSPTIALALDTSSAVTSLAIARGDEIVAARVLRHEDRRSQELWFDLASLLSEAKLSLGDMDVFAVCVGPGGFTGLRVGIAAVKGLAFGTEKPAVGITSLEAAAFGARSRYRVCALVNAYKGEVYSQTFQFDAAGMPVALDEARVSTCEDAIARLHDWDELVLAGDAVPSCQTPISDAAAKRKWSIAKVGASVAESIALLAQMKKESWGEQISACYVRPAEAEVKLAQGLLGSKIRRTISGKA
jgi:tRNA threonylcarbamoyladenosine biosynthesis protein TsaB